MPQVSTSMLGDAPPVPLIRRSHLAEPFFTCSPEYLATPAPTPPPMAGPTARADAAGGSRSDVARSQRPSFSDAPWNIEEPSPADGERVLERSAGRPMERSMASSMAGQAPSHGVRPWDPDFSRTSYGNGYIKELQ